MDTNDFNHHFLLSAESHLLCAQNNFIPKNDSDDIHKSQPYHESYLANIQYNLIVLYHNDSITDECKNHAKSYINNSYAKEAIINSCYDQKPRPA